MPSLIEIGKEDENGEKFKTTPKTMDNVQIIKKAHLIEVNNNEFGFFKKAEGPLIKANLDKVRIFSGEHLSFWT